MSMGDPDEGRLTGQRGAADHGAMASTVLDPAARIDRMLRCTPVVWLSSVRPDGAPHVVPIWFSWDGEAILIASKPNAQKVRNIRANEMVMLALGEPENDFDVGMLQGRAELVDEPAARALPTSHLAKYRDQMAAIGLDAEDFTATYSQVIRIVPTRFLSWHGRSVPPSTRDGLRPQPRQRRLAEAIRRVAARLTQRGPALAPA